MQNVRTHKRKKKNGVTVVRKHVRGKYGPKPKNDKYPARTNSGMSLEEIKKHIAKYQAEFNGLANGTLRSSLRHKAFIARRLQNAKIALKRKLKNSENEQG